MSKKDRTVTLSVTLPKRLGELVTLAQDGVQAARSVKQSVEDFCKWWQQSQPPGTRPQR